MNETEYKKAYLQLYLDYREMADDAGEEFERLDAKKDQIKIATYGLSRGATRRTFEDWVADLEETIRRYSETERDAQEKKLEIERYILTISNHDERKVLTAKYIKGLTWPGVAKDTNFSRARVIQIWKNALDNLPDPYEFRGCLYEPL